MQKGDTQKEPRRPQTGTFLLFTKSAALLLCSQKVLGSILRQSWFKFFIIILIND